MQIVGDMDKCVCELYESLPTKAEKGTAEHYDRHLSSGTHEKASRDQYKYYKVILHCTAFCVCFENCHKWIFL